MLRSSFLGWSQRPTAARVFSIALAFVLASHVHAVNSAGEAAIKWPGRPDRDDSDSPLLPIRSGDLINLRAVDLDLFCNVRDVKLTAAATAASGSDSTLRSVVTCSNTDSAGPEASLLVIGVDFLTDEIREGSRFYIKSQRTNKFCAPTPMPPAPRRLQAAAQTGGETEEGGAAGEGGAEGEGGNDAENRRRRDDDDDDLEPLVVACTKMQYDASCEWRATASAKDPRVIFLQPAHPPARRGSSSSSDGVNGRKESEIGCAPRGRHGLLVCDESVRPRGRSAALEVVKDGLRPDGGDGGDSGSYPHGGGGDYPGGGDNPYWPGGDDDDSDGGNPYWPGGGGRGGRGDDDDSDGDNPYWPGGGGRGEYSAQSSGLGADVQRRPKGKDKGELLPFRTGANVLLTWPRKGVACDTASKPSPYGPYGPGGDDAPYKATAAAALGRRGGGSAAADSADSKAVDAGASPYDYGGDDDPAAAAVWCNASIPDGPDQRYPPYAASRDAAVQQPSKGSEEASLASKWDLDGYVLMGTDFASPEIASGSGVFLKNQNTRKFCRVAGSAAADRHAGLYPGQLVCDLMMSDDEAELVVELVAGKKLAQKEEEEDGEQQQQQTDVELQQPDSEGESAGSRVGGNELAVSRRRAREDHDHDHDRRRHEDEDEEQEEEQQAEADEQEEEAERERRQKRGKRLGDGDYPSGGGDYRPDGGKDSGGGSWPSGGDGEGGQTKVLVHLRAPGNDMRYCAPDTSLRGAPIICDLRRPDTSRHQLTTFALVDAAPSYPSGDDSHSGGKKKDKKDKKSGGGGGHRSSSGISRR